MSILIKNSRVIDPAHKLDARRDIYIAKNRISRIEEKISLRADTVIDAAGKITVPGLVDMHVHLREPGREDKETVASGTAAALKGGITSMLAMPNTTPSIDSPRSVVLLREIIEQTAGARVFICGAITRGRRGKQLVDIASLKKNGIIAVSDDGSSVDSEALFLKALKAAKKNKIPVVSHCENSLLSAGGVVNLGLLSTRLGLRGISRESEYSRVERDIGLAARAKCPVHIAHVSCKESVEIIARSKKKGIAVTAETAPHYFALTEEAVGDYDTNKKMNPPLRCGADAEAIKQGLREGVIDVIASDHAPHTENEKAVEFDRAEFGVIGLETELAVSITVLVRPGMLTWSECVRKLTINPARILGISGGTLGVGRPADLAIIDPDKEWVVGKEGFISKSKNSAFLGARLRGTVEYTICRGGIVYKDSKWNL
ncbi:MAG: dihydroorotase [Candidatus Omnitrophota bacterium]|jgi:dihydroorotase